MNMSKKPIRFPLPLVCLVTSKKGTNYRPRFRMDFGEKQDLEQWLEAKELYFRKRAEASFGEPVKKDEEAQERALDRRRHKK